MKLNKNRDKKKKINKKRKICLIVFLVIIVITAIVIVFNKKKSNETLDNKEEGLSLYDTSLSEYVKETDDGTKVNTSTLINTDKSLDNLSITNIQLTCSSSVTSLTANVTNNSDRATDLTMITAILVDETGKELCRVKGIVRALGVGETGKLNISMSGNYVTAYDVRFEK